MERTNHDPGGSPSDVNAGIEGHPAAPTIDDRSPMAPPPIEPTPPVSPETLRAARLGRAFRATQAQHARMETSARALASTAMFVAQTGTLCAMLVLVAVGLGDTWRSRDYLPADGVQGASLVLLCLGQMAALLLEPSRLSAALQVVFSLCSVALQVLVLYAACGRLPPPLQRLWYRPYYPYRMLVSLWALAGSLHVAGMALYARRNPAATASLVTEPDEPLVAVASDGVGPSIMFDDRL